MKSLARAGRVSPRLAAKTEVVTLIHQSGNTRAPRTNPLVKRTSRRPTAAVWPPCRHWLERQLVIDSGRGWPSIWTSGWSYRRASDGAAAGQSVADAGAESACRWVIVFECLVGHYADSPPCDADGRERPTIKRGLGCARETAPTGKGASAVGAALHARNALGRALSGLPKLPIEVLSRLAWLTP
jgi:hypothetical protein